MLHRILCIDVMGETITTGDVVQWEFGGGIGSGTDSGVVVEAGMDKFGHDDVILVDTGSQTVHIRPHHIVHHSRN